MDLQLIGLALPVIIGIATLLIGIAAMLKPQEMSKKFGISVSGAALPYVMSTGVRDVFMGLIVLILCYQQAWIALGWAHLCIGLVAISDFLVVSKHGDKKTSMIHLFGAIVVVAFGIWRLVS